MEKLEVFYKEIDIEFFNHFHSPAIYQVKKKGGALFLTFLLKLFGILFPWNSILFLVQFSLNNYICIGKENNLM